MNNDLACVNQVIAIFLCGKDRKNVPHVVIANLLETRRRSAKDICLASGGSTLCYGGKLQKKLRDAVIAEVSFQIA